MSGRSNAAKAVTLTDLEPYDQIEAVADIADAMLSERHMVSGVDSFCGLTPDCVGLEVVFYSPVHWTQCLHRGRVLDYDEGIVDISWEREVLGKLDDEEFKSNIHMYNAYDCAVVQ